MPGCLRKIFERLAMLGLLVLAAHAGWRWGPQVFPRIQSWLGRSAPELDGGPPPSPALAESVVARVREFRRGDGEERLALGASELTSVLQHTVSGLVPEGVTAPDVKFAADRLHLKARVALQSFPDLPDLGPVLGILPDTLDVVLEASLMPFGAGKAALLVNRVEASRIPLPRRMIPEVLAAMGRTGEPGLPPEALLLSLPSGVEAAYILGDSLILTNDL